MKIMAIASAGGHWVQLLRLIPAFEGHEVFFASTKPGFNKMVAHAAFYQIPDANQWEKLKLIRCFFSVLKLVSKTRPKVVITTGAAPGLMAIVAGRIFGATTIWIDSIANVEQLSLSGKIATRLANRVYTQWENLAAGKVLYAGNILS